MSKKKKNNKSNMQTHSYYNNTNKVASTMISGGIVAINEDGSVESVRYENGQIVPLESHNVDELIQKKDKQYYTPSEHEMLKDPFDVENLFHYWEKQHYVPSGADMTKWRENARTPYIRDLFEKKLKEHIACHSRTLKNISHQDSGTKVSSSDPLYIPAQYKEKAKTKVVVKEKPWQIKGKIKKFFVIFRNKVIPKKVKDIFARNIEDLILRQGFLEDCKRHNKELLNIKSGKVSTANSFRKEKKSVSKSKGSKNHAIYASTPEPEYAHPSHKKPKYGYARNRYGNIQERDHYVENKQVNSYSGSSTYDREDDNDSIYNFFD